jgi:hypothetical protein
MGRSSFSFSLETSGLVKFYPNTKTNQSSRDISMESHNFLGVDSVKIPNKSLKLLRQKRGNSEFFRISTSIAVL